MITCKTPAAKLILANHLKAHDQDMMEMFAAMGKAFGPADEVGYEGLQQEELKEKLLQHRREVAAPSLQKAKEALNEQKD